MAEKRGESVAFTALYADNLRQIAMLVKEFRGLHINQVYLNEDLLLLLDTFGNRIQYDSIPAKKKRLEEYFEKTSHTVSGLKAAVSIDMLAADLLAKADWLSMNIRTGEWLSNQEGYSWFNGYYDNDGQRLEGDHPNGVRMTLTGQVFALMGGIATDEQTREIIASANHYLLDEELGGHRLNTDFKEVLFNMGRCFGFAFGHKENGAVFNHMVVMYANALYQRGYVREAYNVLNRIYLHSIDFQHSHMYPGIPEYFDARGRGVYPFLTGSASWYLLTVLTQAFGVQGRLGDLELCPKLVREQFDAASFAGIRLWFAGRQLDVQYQNPDQLDFGEYFIDAISADGELLDCDHISGGVKIRRAIILELDPDKIHVVRLKLSKIK